MVSFLSSRGVSAVLAVFSIRVAFGAFGAFFDFAVPAIVRFLS